MSSCSISTHAMLCIHIKMYDMGPGACIIDAHPHRRRSLPARHAALCSLTKGTWGSGYLQFRSHYPFRRRHNRTSLIHSSLLWELLLQGRERRNIRPSISQRVAAGYYLLTSRNRTVEATKAMWFAAFAETSERIHRHPCSPACSSSMKGHTLEFKLPRGLCYEGNGSMVSLPAGSATPWYVILPCCPCFAHCRSQPAEHWASTRRVRVGHDRWLPCRTVCKAWSLMWASTPKPRPKSRTTCKHRALGSNCAVLLGSRAGKPDICRLTNPSIFKSGSSVNV